MMKFREIPLSRMIGAELCASLPVHSFAKGEILFLKDDTEDSIYFVKSGRAKAISFDTNGKSIFFQDFKAGDIFGYYSTLTKKPRTATLVSDSDLEIYKIKAQAFTDFITADPDRALMMISYLAFSLRHNSLRLSRNAILSAQDRVATFLVYLMEENRSSTLAVDNREDFASQLDMTRETLSRVLNKFSKDGLITLSSAHIEILDAPALYIMISQE